jgi:D-amino acid aminotransferase
VVWQDGRIVAAHAARVSVFERGFLYGDGVFETVRVYDGVPFLWPRHEQRLRASLAALSIPRPRHDLASAIRELLDASRMLDAAVRVTVTRGVGEGLAPPRGLAPTVLLTLRAIDPSLPERRGTGVAAALLPFGHGRGGVSSGHKTLGYLPAVLGRAYAERHGAAEGIYVEADGTLSEGTTSNVFVMIDGRLTTPPAASGCLAGITREVVIDLARGEGIAVEESPIAALDLARAGEMLVSGSVIEVMPIVRLDDRPIGDGRPGPVTRLLQELYQRRLRRTLARHLASPGRAPHAHRAPSRKSAGPSSS